MKQYILIIASVVALSVLSAVNVKAQDFHTSTMAATGSQYTSPVTAPGAEAVTDLATTTYDQSGSSRANIRRISEGGGMGQGDDPGSAAEGSPIGAPLIPLVLFATAYAVVKRK